MKKSGRSEKLILSKLAKIDRKMSSIEKIGKKTVKEEKKIEGEEKKIESVLFRLGKLTFQRKHFLELIRGTAGAFLGVGLGMNLINTKNLATNLAWFNIIGILIFILVISSLLIYKNAKDFVKKDGKKFIFKRLFWLYFISIVVELIAFALFGGIPGSSVLLVKMLIIGSYSAMAGAVSFSIV